MRRHRHTGVRAWRKSSREPGMARNDLILTNGTTLVAYPGLETMSDVDGFAKKLAAAGIPLLIFLECAYGTQVTSTTVIYRRHIQNTVG
jgi:hypothetical protein